MRTIFGDPIYHPDQPVSAFVGAFASDFLGDYDTPADAVGAAHAGGYGVVHVMYGDGCADAIDTASLARVLTYCTDCPAELALVVQTDEDQVPTDPETWADLIENLTDDIVPSTHDTTHVLAYQLVKGKS